MKLDSIVIKLFFSNKLDKLPIILKRRENPYQENTTNVIKKTTQTPTVALGVGVMLFSGDLFDEHGCIDSTSSSSPGVAVTRCSRL